MRSSSSAVARPRIAIRPPDGPVYYHTLIADISAQVLVIEQLLIANRCRSLKDCMFRMHSQWEALRLEWVELLHQVQTTKMTGTALGQVDIGPIRTELCRLVGESLQFLVRLSEVPEVMTRAQAVAQRDRT